MHGAPTRSTSPPPRPGRSARGLAPLALLALLAPLALLACACASDPSPDPDAASLDVAPDDSTDADATPDTTDADAASVSAVIVTVTLDGAPVADARVTQGGASRSVLTDAAGRALVPVDPHVVGDRVFNASHPEARTGAAEWYGEDALTIALTRYDPRDNPDYLFQDPGEPTRRDSSGQCAHCHVTINEDWFASPHRTSASNPTVQDLYRHAVLPDLNPGCDGPDCADATAFGGCADCHAPGIDGPLGGRDLRDATGFALDYGVHCDVCHRVDAVDLDALEPGVAGRLRLHRPSEPSRSPALGAWQPLTFGPHHDVPNPRMGLVQRDHFNEASLCAGCHELDQPALVPGAALDPERWPSGRLPIHSTYSEWLAGPLGGAVPCQSCHMPPAPTAWNAADLQLFAAAAAGVAAGWLRPPGAVNRHTWYGPRQPDAPMLALAAALTLTTERDGDTLVVRATVKNVGPGHALPTGEPLRALILRVFATCGPVPLEPTGGDAVPDFGGALDAQTADAPDADWALWPGAAVGDVVRVVRRPGAFHDYQGHGPFSDRFDAPAKGLPVEHVAGHARVTAVDPDGRVTFDRPLPEGDVAYRVGPDQASEGAASSSDPASWSGPAAGAPGFAFARVLVGADGARMVPHHAAVDVASDNRLLPQASWTSEHRFAAPCAEPVARAVLAHRAYPFDLARARGWDPVDTVMADVTSAPPSAPQPVAPAPAPDDDVARFTLRAAPATIDVPAAAFDPDAFDPDAVDPGAVDPDAGAVAASALAYNGQVPGPILRVRRGQRVVVELDNALDVPTTIHWHGVRVPWAMDGATWKQDPVPPGGTFVYDFVATDAGTFWYHPHFDTDRQVDRGLFGALVVEDPDEPAADADLVFVFDTWAEAPADPGAHGASGDVHGGQAHGHGVDDRARRWLVNGALDPTVTLQGGTVARARFVNASNSGYLALAWPDMAVIATDQGLLTGRHAPERLLLAPGDRAEAEWRVGEAGFTVSHAPYSLHGGDLALPEERLLTVAVDAPAPAPPGLDWPFSTAPPTPDPGHTDAVWVFHGSDHTDDWRINGERFPDVTPVDLALGQVAVLEVRNLSATEHPFHLHGHVFEVLSVDGVPPAQRLVEDTVNLPLYGTVRLLLHADNPGEWMAHCHILPHAHGMMTLLRVTP